MSADQPLEEEILGEEEEKPEEPPIKKCKQLKVLVTNDNIPSEALDLLNESCEVHFLPVPGDQKLFMRYCQGMNGVLLDDPNLFMDREFFRGSALGMKVISIVGWHGKQVDCTEAKKRKVRVGVCPTTLSVDSTAEVAVGMALMLCRRLKEGNNALLRGIADIKRPNWLLGIELKNCVCGIIGLGKLGVSVAVRLQAFWPKKIVYYSRRSKKAGQKLSIERILLDDLIQSSDIVFLCLPCTDATREMFDNEVFAKMKKCSFLINPSHGNLVKVNDLYCALRRGAICGAAMDAELADSPNPKHPIHKLDNFFLLPNVGRSSALVRLRMHVAAVENLISGLTLKMMTNPYPPESDEEFVETDEEKAIREAEETRLRQIQEENFRLEKEDRLRLEEEERMRLLAELEAAAEEAKEEETYWDINEENASTVEEEERDL